jgi:hypothetical protein
MKCGNLWQKWFDMDFLGYLLECFIDSCSLYVVRATRTAGITGDTLPDKKVVQDFFPFTEYDHPDQTVGSDSRLVPYGTTCCTSPALVTGKNVLT